MDDIHLAPPAALSRHGDCKESAGRRDGYSSTVQLSDYTAAAVFQKFGGKMGSKVYSAARAFFPLHGKSKEEAWKQLTAMFGPGTRTEKTYIVNGYPLECIKRRTFDDISLGDVFKYTAWLGSETHIQIMACAPYESFAYDEKYIPKSGQNVDTVYEHDGRTRMEFFLRSHPEATLVEIRRRSKGRPLTWRERLFGEDHSDSAAKLLQIITTSTANHNGMMWEDGETTCGDITVKRDDSYRIDF